MERLSIDEIIEHCERKTKLYEEVGKNIDFETTELTDAIKEYWEHKQVKEYLEELKEYRDLEDQRLLLCFPCKVGDTVYYKTIGNDIYTIKITEIKLSNSGTTYNGYFLNCAYEFDSSDFGKTVFLTQAEAEKKLKGDE